MPHGVDLLRCLERVRSAQNTEESTSCTLSTKIEPDTRGLVPAIHVLQNINMAGGYVYILTNRPNGILYVGVTNDLVRRIFEHRSGFVDGFTKRYGLKRLVYFERFDDIRDAIQREHNIKHWSRAWRVRTIVAANPNWDDLYPTITQ
jgi:putative endonuclease